LGKNLSEAIITYSYLRGSMGLVLAACQAGHRVARKAIRRAEALTSKKSPTFILAGRWLR
jgi:hypothetical protein